MEDIYRRVGPGHEGGGFLFIGFFPLMMGLLMIVPAWMWMMLIFGGIALAVSRSKQIEQARQAAEDAQLEEMAMKEVEKEEQEEERIKKQKKTELLGLMKYAYSAASTESKETMKSCILLYQGIDEVKPQVQNLMMSIFTNYKDIVASGIETENTLESKKKIEDSFEFVKSILSNIYDKQNTQKTTNVEVDLQTLKMYSNQMGLTKSDFDIHDFEKKQEESDQIEEAEEVDSAEIKAEDAASGDVETDDAAADGNVTEQPESEQDDQEQAAS